MEKLKITFNISFPSLNCKEANANAMDVAGDLQINMYHSVFKMRLDMDGIPIGNETDSMVSGKHSLPDDYCGECFGSRMKGICCNTCAELTEAYASHGWSLENMDKHEQCNRDDNTVESKARVGEGCRLFGSMKVNRVAGNFHVALGKTFSRDGRVMHQFGPGDQFRYNASHIIHRCFYIIIISYCFLHHYVAYPLVIHIQA